MRLPTHYTIRDLRISPAVVLAPMEGVTDVTFRRLVRQIGDCGMTTTEFVASEGLTRNVERMHEMCEFDEGRAAVAIRSTGGVGCVAQAAASSGHGPHDRRPQYGLPLKKVCAHSGGSAPKDRDSRGRSCAMRALASLHGEDAVRFDLGNRNAPDRVHVPGGRRSDHDPRTRADGYSGERAVDKIAERRRGSIPVLANGDIVDIRPRCGWSREAATASWSVAAPSAIRGSSNGSRSTSAASRSR
jgi:tRNA-dihydrouridine synthase B